MHLWKKGTEIAIWGTGKYARKFYLRYRHYFRVRFFVDNFPKKDSMDSVSIITPDEIPLKKIKVVIAISDYKEVCDQCKELGMDFLDDYLPYDLIGFSSLDFIRLWELVGDNDIKPVFQKIVKDNPYCVLVGPCQLPVIKRMLLSSNQFRQKYFILDIPLIHMLTQKQKEIIEQCQFIFTECSLCITQYITSNNAFFAFYATENIRRLVNPNIQVIVLPVLFFDLYFPQTIHQNDENSLLSEVGVLSFPYADCILNELSRKYSAEDIVKIVKMDNLFSDKLLQWMYDTRLEEMRKRENLYDVKMYDYILEHFKEEQLFYSKNHPCKKVYVEFGRRILEKIGFNDGEIEEVRLPIMDGWQEAIYPSVASHYGLCFDKTLYLDPMVDEECELEEFIRLYLSVICDKRT